jgi:hypothetical protein
MSLPFLLITHLIFRGISFVPEVDSRLARLAVALIACSLFGVGIFMLFFIPLSIERLRLFVNTGWKPLLWFFACLLGSTAPANWYIWRQFGNLKHSNSTPAGRSPNGRADPLKDVSGPHPPST